MTIVELQLKLLEAYSVNNLNRISLTLINLFKNRQFTILQKISELISDLVPVKIADDGRGFSKLMMLYHPDRAVYHRNEINKLTYQNNFDALLVYTHILKLERIEEIAASISNLEDIDYAPVYEWDMEADGFSIIFDTGSANVIRTRTRTGLTGYDFYDAIKIREFGNTDVEFPSFYLEDIEEFELSSSDINDLEGIQFCIHAININLSNNRISDLTPLTGLSSMEELDLSNNLVSYIDALSNLVNLKSLILSDNFIEDISPLFYLENLEYVDLSGNKIDIEQVNILTGAGVTVNIEY